MTTIKTINGIELKVTNASYLGYKKLSNFVENLNKEADNERCAKLVASMFVLEPINPLVKNYLIKRYLKG